MEEVAYENCTLPGHNNGISTANFMLIFPVSWNDKEVQRDSPTWNLQKSTKQAVPGTFAKHGGTVQPGPAHPRQHEAVGQTELHCQRMGFRHHCFPFILTGGWELYQQ